MSELTCKQSDKASSKKNTQNDKVSKKYDKAIPVFRIKPEKRSSSCIVKYVGYVIDDEKIGDEVVELDKPIHPEYEVFGRHTIPFKKIGEFNMLGRLYRCNIVGSHIVMSSRYPLMYLTVEYDRPL